MRLICAGLLVDHFDRVGRVDQLLRSGDLSTRAAVLKTLSLKKYFDKTYLQEPSYRVRETIREWLANDGDLTRYHAIQLAVRLKMHDTADAIRPLVKRSGDAGVHMREERELVIAAMGAMEAFGVCDAAPELRAAAREDADAIVRLRAMQMLDRMSFRKKPPAVCPGVVSETDMATLVKAALGDGDHAVRMGAMIILARAPSWIDDAARTRLHEILDGDFSGAERRHALDALVADGRPEMLESLPRYFHDKDRAVRSTVSTTAATLKDQKLEGCLIGLLQGEAEQFDLFYAALEALRTRAKKLVGFPLEMQRKRIQAAEAVQGRHERDVQRRLLRRGDAGHRRRGLVRLVVRRARAHRGPEGRSGGGPARPLDGDREGGRRRRA